MKILVLIPAYKFMEIPAVQSLCALQNDVLKRGDSIELVFSYGFNAAKSRAQMFDFAASKSADWVLCLDSDHVYPSQALYSLIERAESENLSLLSGTYFVRAAEQTIAHGSYKEGKYRQFKAEELNGHLVEADVLGLGFVIIRPQLIRALMKEHGREVFRMDAGENGDEAVHLCKVLKESGLKLLFDPSVKIGHLSTMVRT